MDIRDTLFTWGTSNTDDIANLVLFCVIYKITNNTTCKAQFELKLSAYELTYVDNANKSDYGLHSDLQSWKPLKLLHLKRPVKSQRLPNSFAVNLIFVGVNTLQF